jgi:hypothetical protein
LPGRGIYVAPGTYGNSNYLDLMQHEYGHILQAKMIGNVAFYSTIAPASTVSANLNGIGGHSHKNYWTETSANYLSKEYFGSKYIYTTDFPIRDNANIFFLLKLY